MRTKLENPQITRTTGRSCGLADNVQERHPHEHQIIQSIFSVGPVMLSAVVVVGRDDALSAKALRSEAALLGKLGLHGRFNFVSEAAEVFMKPAVHFPLGRIGGEIAD